MKIWPVQEAKAKFSEMPERCVAEGPPMVSKRGVAEAVLVPAAELGEDTMIAAVARVNEMTVATRNVKDFERFGLEVVNPFRRLD